MPVGQYATIELRYTMHSMFWPRRRSYAKQTHRHAKQLFFILEPKFYPNFKEIHRVSKWKGSLAHFATSFHLCRRAAVFGVSRSVFGTFRLPPFGIANHFFEIMLILYWQLTWMTSLVLGKRLYVFWWTVKTAEQVRSQKSGMGGCYGDLAAVPPMLKKFVICWQK